jgi:hypothetical protein
MIGILYWQVGRSGWSLAGCRLKYRKNAPRPGVFVLNFRGLHSVADRFRGQLPGYCAALRAKAAETR